MSMQCFWHSRFVRGGLIRASNFSKAVTQIMFELKFYWKNFVTLIKLVSIKSFKLLAYKHTVENFECVI